MNPRLHNTRLHKPPRHTARCDASRRNAHILIAPRHKNDRGTHHGPLVLHKHKRRTHTHRHQHDLDTSRLSTARVRGHPLDVHTCNLSSHLTRQPSAPMDDIITCNNHPKLYPGHTQDTSPTSIINHQPHQRQQVRASQGHMLVSTPRA